MTLGIMLTAVGFNSCMLSCRKVSHAGYIHTNEKRGEFFSWYETGGGSASVCAGLLLLPAEGLMLPLMSCSTAPSFRYLKEGERAPWLVPHGKQRQQHFLVATGLLKPERWSLERENKENVYVLLFFNININFSKGNAEMGAGGALALPSGCMNGHSGSSAGPARFTETWWDAEMQKVACSAPSLCSPSDMKRWLIALFFCLVVLQVTLARTLTGPITRSSAGRRRRLTSASET